MLVIGFGVVWRRNILSELGTEWDNSFCFRGVEVSGAYILADAAL